MDLIASSSYDVYVSFSFLIVYYECLKQIRLDKLFRIDNTSFSYISSFQIFDNAAFEVAGIYFQYSSSICAILRRNSLLINDQSSIYSYLPSVFKISIAKELE